MLKAPYLIVAFAVAPGTPNADALLQQVEDTIPWSPPPLPLGVENVYAMEVTTANMFKRWDELTNFLDQTDQQNGGVLRWFVQLCQTPDISGG